MSLLHLSSGASPRPHVTALSAPPSLSSGTCVLAHFPLKWQPLEDGHPSGPAGQRGSKCTGFPNTSARPLPRFMGISSLNALAHLLARDSWCKKRGLTRPPAWRPSSRPEAPGVGASARSCVTTGTREDGPHHAVAGGGESGRQPILRSRRRRARLPGRFPPRALGQKGSGSGLDFSEKTACSITVTIRKYCQHPFSENNIVSLNPSKYSVLLFFTRTINFLLQPFNTIY